MSMAKLFWSEKQFFFDPKPKHLLKKYCNIVLKVRANTIEEKKWKRKWMQIFEEEKAKVNENANICGRAQAPDSQDVRGRQD